VVRHVADLLQAAGDGLRAGDVVICGALTPNIWPGGGDRVEADFGPLGRVDVSFRSASG
jgi:2-keto-4-pentenoate hydratase